MRAARVVIGMLALLLALPALAAGIAAAWLTGHDSPDGAFHAAVAPLRDPERVLVVSDIDALLRRDVPYARVGGVELRLSASSGNTPAFVGIAAPDEVAAYLAGVRYTEVAQTRIGPGPLLLRTNRMDAPGREPGDPTAEDFWLRQGLGSLSWHPEQDRGRHLALVVVLRDAPSTGPALPSDALSLDVALDADWLASAMWGVLILAIVLLVVALVTLAWPGRPAETAPEPADDELTSLLDPADDGTIIALPADTDPGLTAPPAPEQRAPEPETVVREQLDVPWAGAPYTGPAEDTVAWPAPSAPRGWFESPAGARRSEARADGRFAAAVGAGHAEAVTVASAVPAMRSVPAPDLPWPPLRGELPGTQPVRDVITEEFLPGIADRPACTLRLERIPAAR
ncbi:hypothetical protein [Catellatospora bangladeshensis]|uniref:Uncharacterized protein n=1 Tax=Catellatospora bangladeshensis TaxID=310355 RepID=A0A8J3NM79_9ACTN|nr:hypothetical protein [Catellatospora bangladeshensis]GIF84793.1 hypothetical protein Cba03nite_61420 [Catellatospora bangladeshensis]